MVEVLDPQDETVTRGSPYNFAILNSPETDHLVKQILMKPIVMEQGQVRIPHCEVSDIEEQ